MTSDRCIAKSPRPLIRIHYKSWAFFGVFRVVRGYFALMPMPVPHGFSWIEKPHLAGMAHPESEEDLEWLRQNGVDVLLSLTEEPVRREWPSGAGLLVVHDLMVVM